MNIDDLNILYSHITRLKKLKRTGWARNNVKEPESVADHSFGLALLTLFFAKKLNLDASRATLIALLHDLGESIIGDITPHDGIDKKEKSEKESASVEEILNDDELYELWLDFEEGRTEEGRLVKQLDKFEAYLQAREYKVSKATLGEFYKSTFSVLEHDILKEILESLEKSDVI